MLPYQETVVARRWNRKQQHSNPRAFITPPPPSAGSATPSGIAPQQHTSFFVLPTPADEEEGKAFMSILNSAANRKQHNRSSSTSSASAMRREPAMTPARSSSIIPPPSDDDCSVSGSPSRFNLRSSTANNKPQQPQQVGLPLDHIRQHQRSASLGRLLPSTGNTRNGGLGMSGEDTRRSRTPGDGARRTPPAYKLDPCAALDLAKTSPMATDSSSSSSIDSHRRQQQQNTAGGTGGRFQHRRAMSLSTSDLQNVDLAVETDPARMRAEIRRLRNALIELYRGPNRLVGGSQFRTLVRDTDAPYHCVECEGLKAFIKNLQRDHRTLRDHSCDLEARVSRCEPYAGMLGQAEKESRELRSANESLESMLRLRDRKVETLQHELVRVVSDGQGRGALDGEGEEGEDKGRLDRLVMEMKDVKDKLQNERTVHSLELCHVKRMVDEQQHKVAGLQADRDALAVVIAGMRGVEVGALGSLADELVKIKEDMAARRAEAAKPDPKMEAELTKARQEVMLLREARREAQTSLHQAETALIKAREETSSLMTSKQVLQQDFDKVVRERDALTETLKRESSSVRKGIESIMNTSAVRVCVVAPTVNVHLSQHKSVVYKSSVAKEKIREFVEQQVLPRFVSLFVQQQEDEEQNDDSEAAQIRPRDTRPAFTLNKNDAGSGGGGHGERPPTRSGGGGGGAGGLDVWVETMLMEIQTVVEGNIARIFHEERQC